MPTQKRISDTSVWIREGLLTCRHCSRWYPIRAGLPELLPVALRDDEAEMTWATALTGAEMGPPFGVEAPAADSGLKYKRAEMAVASRNLPEGFFETARVAPFYALRTEFDLDLLLRFATTVQKIPAGHNGLILDLGVGTAWTSEWLLRLGYRVIGIDITRDYLLAGLPRMQGNLPHLIVADVENLPLRSAIFDGVLSFDSFHHVPNRSRALREIARVMQPGTTMAFVEPGKAHENHPISIAVMEQHGILEVGFDTNDLKGYIEGSDLTDVRYHRTDAHPHDMHTLRKSGQQRLTSRTPRKMLMGMQLTPQTRSVRAGEPVSLGVKVRNEGDTLWLARTEEGEGRVFLGAHLYDAERALLQEQALMIPLPHDVAPGELLELEIRFPAPAQAGEYLYEFDLRVEGMLWFKDDTYRAQDLRLAVAEGAGVAQPAVEAQVVSWKLIPAPGQALAGFAAPVGLAGAIRNVYRSQGLRGVLRQTWVHLTRRLR